MRRSLERLRSRRPLFERLWLDARPARRIVVGSLLAVLIGALLLWSPLTHAPGQGIGFLAALLTSTSALCTTGLSTVNVAKVFNSFGLLVLMVLIQLGGLGLLTVSFWVALHSRRGDSVRQRLGVLEQLNLPGLADGVGLVRQVVALSLATEGVGALLLLPSFVGAEGWGRGSLYAALHSVMAFNNAGFGVYDDGLARFRGDVLLNLTLMALIVLGGLGFVVLENVRGFLAGKLLASKLRASNLLRNRRRNPLQTHTKIALTAFAALLVVGAVGITALEWSRAFGSLPPWERVMAGTFQSVSARSAGFNTVDLANFAPATLALLMLLMFVGANPNSTGGGIKGTTALVLLAFSWAVVRGRTDARLFRRRVATLTLLRAVTVLMLGLIAVSLGVFALTLTDPGLPFVNLAFEAVSAFGTAGLSVDTTPRLSGGGQVVVTVLMFAGRVGFLTLLTAWGRRREPLVKYPEESSILVG